jgi:uncharacterized membrane protein
VRARAQYTWHRLTASLWFLPLLLMGGAVALSFITLYIDTAFEMRMLAVPGTSFHVGPEGSRGLLATIAGSMITVASLVFSMTLVTLQLASSQLGPRLISRFMQDRINQTVLGTFLGTFLFALMVLRTITGEGEEAFVPEISTLVAILLAVASLGWLVYFIHHLAEAIQADTVIAEVGGQIRDSVGRIFPEVELAPGQLASGAVPSLARLSEPPGEIACRDEGYVQAVDVVGLSRFAARHDLLIELLRRPGHFVIPGTAAARVWPAPALDERVADAVRRSIVIGYRRTATQDIEFAIGSLVQIALRALSPALNDPITGAACIDRLASSLVRIMQRPPPPSQIPDEDGEIRLIVHPTTFEGAIDAAFDDVRQSAQGQVRTLIRLVEALTTLASFIRDDEQRRAIEKHAIMVERACRETIAEGRDRTDAEERLEELRQALQR